METNGRTDGKTFSANAVDNSNGDDDDDDAHLVLISGCVSLNKCTIDSLRFFLSYLLT